MNLCQHVIIQQTYRPIHMQLNLFEAKPLPRSTNFVTPNTLITNMISNERSSVDPNYWNISLFFLEFSRHLADQLRGFKINRRFEE